MDLSLKRLDLAVNPTELVAYRVRRQSEVSIEIPTNSGKPLFITSIPHILYVNKFESLKHE